MNRKVLAAGCALTVFASVGLAQQGEATAPAKQPENVKGTGEKAEPMKIGAKAPPLSVETWVKGEKIDGFKPGEIYVVEFWATWCAPCRDSIPHLTQVQADYKDKKVHVLGISSSQFRGEAEDGVRSFVESAGDNMVYSVGFDADGSMARDWMEAANARGIPAAFLVDGNGVIAYIGNPFDMDETLARMVNGTFDVQKEVMQARARAGLDAKAKPILDEARKSAEAGDWSAVVYQIDRVIELDPQIMGDWSVTRLQISLTKLGDSAASYAFARKAIEEYVHDNPDALDSIAWFILTNAEVAERDLDLALLAANRAHELTAGKNASVLDTLAKAHAARGEFDDAVRFSEQAVELAPDNEKAEYEGRLAEYRASAEEAHKG